MTIEPLFLRDGARFVPGAATASPWGPDVMHGAPATGLLAWALEDALDNRDLHLARLTVDLFRAVPRAPLDVSVRSLRGGRRIASLEAVLVAGEQVVAHATGLFLALGDDPAGDGDTLAGPDGLPEGFRGVERSPLVRRSFTAHIDIREAADGAAAWFRLPMPVVEGGQASGAVRVATLIDLGNLVANWGSGARQSEGLRYINADTTLYLARPPRGEWVAMRLDERMRMEASDLLALTVFDETGRLGHASHARLAQPRAVK